MRRNRVLVCGGRHYSDRKNVFDTLNKIHAANRITMVIEGGCRDCKGGMTADLLARLWAEQNYLPVMTIPADWVQHSDRAGPIRNAQMLNMRPSLCIAFPGGAGTADMVKRSRAAKIETREIPPRDSAT